MIKANSWDYNLTNFKVSYWCNYDTNGIIPGAVLALPVDLTNINTLEISAKKASGSSNDGIYWLASSAQINKTTTATQPAWDAPTYTTNSYRQPLNTTALTYNTSWNVSSLSGVYYVGLSAFVNSSGQKVETGSFQITEVKGIK